MSNSTVPPFSIQPHFRVIPQSLLIRREDAFGGGEAAATTPEPVAAAAPASPTPARSTPVPPAESEHALDVTA